ncbi:MAG: hypothetical protein V4505_25575 [Pseudomonadota bacterium]
MDTSLFGSPDTLNNPLLNIGLSLLGHGNVGAKLQAGFAQAQAMQLAQAERAQKQKLMEAQLANYTSEIGARDVSTKQAQQLQDLIRSRFPGGMPGAAAPGGAAPAPDVVAAPAGAPGVPPTQSMGAPAPAAPARPGGIAGFTPDDLALFKLSGKDLTDVWKETQPDMQVSNGYAYDKKKLPPGYIPQLNYSSTGQASQVQIGPDGQPVISAPRGALDTYRSYKEADAGITDRHTPQKIYNPATKRFEWGTQAEVTAPGGSTGQNPPGLRPDGDVEGLAIRQRELEIAQKQLAEATQAGDKPRAMRLQSDVAGLGREISRMSGKVAMAAPAGRLAAEPSVDEAAAAAAQSAAGSSVAGQTGPLMKESVEAANGAVQAVQSAQRMQQALDSDKVLSGPTASLRLKGLQIASVLGIGGKDDAEKIANTRQAVQEMAKLTLAGRKQMQGQGAITNQESNLAERATSGSIDDLTAAEIRQLAVAAERVGRFQYAQHQTKLDAMGKNPATAGNVPFFTPAAMPDVLQAAPAGSGAHPKDIGALLNKYGGR